MLFKTKHLSYVTHIRARTFLVEHVYWKRHHDRQKCEKSETRSLRLLIEIDVSMAMQQKIFQNFSPGEAEAFGNNIEMEPQKPHWKLKKHTYDRFYIFTDNICSACNPIQVLDG